MKTYHRFFIITLLCLQGSLATAQKVEIGNVLPEWSEGYLDIHAINTGRGEQTFFIFPDGTTMLVDAGEFPSTTPNMVPQKPDEQTRPSETILKYIQHFIKPTGGKAIDYMLLTHFHMDHMGLLYKGCPWSQNKAYQLTGITAIGDKIPFKKIIDRGWSIYPSQSTTMDNYCKFVNWHVKNNNTQIESFRVGNDQQIVLNKKSKKYPTFNIRNIAANGCVWTGVDTVSRNYFLPAAAISSKYSPSENACSIAFRLSYGKFDYFSGGDLPSVTRFDWEDIEGPVGFVTGPVEACKSNHHMNFDTMGLKLLKNLRPQVVVVQNFYAQQPDMGVLRRVLSEQTYPGEKSIFCTNLHDAAKLAAYNTIGKLKDSCGHIVIRVQPNGNEFYVYMLDDTNDQYKVRAIYGPYKCN